MAPRRPGEGRFKGRPGGPALSGSDRRRRSGLHLRGGGERAGGQRHRRPRPVLPDQIQIFGRPGVDRSLRSQPPLLPGGSGRPRGRKAARSNPRPPLRRRLRDQNRAGMASGMGVALKLPTIGVSKNVLCGSFDPPRHVGEASPLAHQGERVGYVLLSKKGCRPMVVAPGHRVSVESALDLAKRYLRDQKLPLPCLAAHRHAKEVKRRILMGDISVSSGTRIFHPKRPTILERPPSRPPESSA